MKRIFSIVLFLLNLPQNALFCKGFWDSCSLLWNYRLWWISAEWSILLLPVSNKIGSNMERVTTKDFREWNRDSIWVLNITCTLLRKGMHCFSGKGCSEFPKKVHYCVGILTKTGIQYWFDVSFDPARRRSADSHKSASSFLILALSIYQYPPELITFILFKLSGLTRVYRLFCSDRYKPHSAFLNGTFNSAFLAIDGHPSLGYIPLFCAFRWS